MTDNEAKQLKPNDYIGYTVMLRGGIEQLTWKQQMEVMDVCLLANDYERLRIFTEEPSMKQKE